MYTGNMKTLLEVNPNIDRFEGEGGALAGPAEITRQKEVRESNGTPGGRRQPASWRVRPVFLAELEDLLNSRDASEAELRTRRNGQSDLDEEFVQRFQELIDTQVLPQFEGAAALLSKRFYPVEVRVAGKPRERVCFFTFSQEKEPGNWARNGESITGPRMMFSAHMKGHCVLYTANFRHGVACAVERVMQITEITDSFIEQELRHLFDSAGVEESRPAKALDGAVFLRSARRACS
jgi:hypothetical protein